MKWLIMAFIVGSIHESPAERGTIFPSCHSELVKNLIFDSAKNKNFFKFVCFYGFELA